MRLDDAAIEPHYSLAASSSFNSSVFFDSHGRTFEDDNLRAGVATDVTQTL